MVFSIIGIILLVLIIGLFMWKSKKEEEKLPPVFTAPSIPIITPMKKEETDEPFKEKLIEEQIPITPIETIYEDSLIQDDLDEEIEDTLLEDEEDLLSLLSKEREEILEDEIDKELEDVDKELEDISRELEDLEGGDTWESLAELRSRILEEEKEEEELGELEDMRRKLLEEDEEIDIGEEVGNTGKNSKNYYKVIDGERYDRELLETANDLIKDKDVEILSLEDAELIWIDANDGGKVTDVEIKTLEHILENIDCSESAREYLRENIDNL